MTFWDSVMKEIFPWILATALLLAGSAFLYAGVKLTSTAQAALVGSFLGSIP